MIEIEEDTIIGNNFLENLNHQITQKYFRFYSKIPMFHEKLDDMDFKLKLKESIFKIRKNFDLAQFRRNYASVINEFEEILQKK